MEVYNIEDGHRTKVVNEELLKRITEMYNAFDTTEEAIEHIMKVLKINLSRETTSG